MRQAMRMRRMRPVMMRTAGYYKRHAQQGKYRQSRCFVFHRSYSVLKNYCAGNKGRRRGSCYFLLRE